VQSLNLDPYANARINLSFYGSFGDATGRISILQNGHFPFEYLKEIGGTVYDDPDAPDANLISLRSEIVWGQPMYMSIELDGAANAAGAGDCCYDVTTALLDASGYWNGVESISQGGLGVTDWTVTSASGVDYSTSLRPVPEPTTWALMVAGLLVLAVGRMRVCRAGSRRDTRILST
jgi:PEP-CTERM motif